MGNIAKMSILLSALLQGDCSAVFPIRGREMDHVHDAARQSEIENAFWRK